LLGSFWILLNKIYFKRASKNVENYNENINTYAENVGDKTSKIVKNSAKLTKKININTGNVEELKKFTVYWTC